MTLLTILLTFILLSVVVIQLGKISDLTSKIRGEETAQKIINDRNALWGMIFMVVFLVGCVVSAVYYKNYMLGYGPHTSASAHGSDIDSLFNVTLFWTGIVFIITHVFLFWFAYKYREQKGRKAFFFPHNNTLEIVWTAVPFAVLTFLVVRGLQVWNDVMPDVDANEQYMEIEATGYQFNWDIRYPGADGELGVKDYTLIGGINGLGQDWTDTRNIDDFLPSEIWLPKDEKVRVRITSKDVLHNFYLPHFRVKMDAVPGLPTYFIFTPTKTTEEYRQELKKYPEWQIPADPTEPDGPQKWETFNYELACAELCGKGHYSMRRIVKVVEAQEYAEWEASQNSYYLSNIRNTDDDPFKGELLQLEIDNRKGELISEFDEKYKSEDRIGSIINLKHVFFETGSSALKEVSKYELTNVASVLNQYKDINIELSGHTDSQGDDDANQILSEQRAEVVLQELLKLGVDSSRLSSKGYGESNPIDSNETAEGRQNNRRTELKIIS